MYRSYCLLLLGVLIAKVGQRTIEIHVAFANFQ